MDQRTELTISSNIVEENKTSRAEIATSDEEEARSTSGEVNVLHTGKSLLDEDETDEVDVIDTKSNVVDDDEEEETSSIDQSDGKAGGREIETEVEEEQNEESQQMEVDVSNRTNGESEIEEKALHIDLRHEEAALLGAEIIFENNKDRCYNGWDNLRWMAYSGIRKISAAEPVYRYSKGRNGLLWNTDEYEQRKLAVYEHPNVILILREASCLAELRDLMELPHDAKFDESALSAHLFVESVIDPKTAKLRLSPLTTATSIIPEMRNECARRRSTFELINPAESISLSAVRLRKDGEKSSFTDSGAFLETSGVEYVLIKSICSAYELSHDANELQYNDFAWKHQIILGTLHSFVVLGNQKHLDLAIHQALRSKDGQSNLDVAIQQASEKQNPRFLNPRIIDAMDESGKTALHYACESRFSSAVDLLAKAGADVNLRIEDLTPCHICSKMLDFNSLATILAVSRRPNEVDYLGRSPMYLAITEGRSVGGRSNPLALERCIEIMAKFGGQVGELLENRHPASVLASQFQADELAILLKYSRCKYPLHVTKQEELGISLSALYQYPVHSTLISLKRRLHDLTASCEDGRQLWRECAGLDTEVNK